MILTNPCGSVLRGCKARTALDGGTVPNRVGFLMVFVMQGWIKLHRKMTEWEWFQKSEMVHLFIHLILMANHEPKPWQGIDVKRGQVVTGLKALKKATGISTQTLRTCLSKLEKSGNLTSKSTNKYRVITICNYNTYQIKETDTNKQTNNQLTNNQQSTNNQLTPNKNDKNESNENNDNKKDFVTNVSDFSQEDSVSFASDEVKFYDTVSRIFHVISRSDRTSLKNVSKYLRGQAENGYTEIFNEAYEFAKTSKKDGDKPIALFMSIMKKEFGYRKIEKDVL